MHKKDANAAAQHGRSPSANGISGLLELAGRLQRIPGEPGVALTLHICFQLARLHRPRRRSGADASAATSRQIELRGPARSQEHLLWSRNFPAAVNASHSC